MAVRGWQLVLLAALATTAPRALCQSSRGKVGAAANRKAAPAAPSRKPASTPDAALPPMLPLLPDVWLRHAWCPDGKRLALAAGDHGIQVWPADGGGKAAWLKGIPIHTFVAALAYSADGKSLAFVSAECQVYQCDSKTSAARLMYTLPASCNWATMSADGATAVILGEDRKSRQPIACVWRASAPDRADLLPSEAAGAGECWLSPDGRVAALIGKGGDVQIWDLGARTRLATIAARAAIPDTRQEPTVAFRSDAKVIAFQDQATKHIRFWDSETGAEVRGYPTVEGAILGFWPSGGNAISRSANHTMFGILKPDGEVLTLPAPGKRLAAASVSPDGKLIALSGSEGKLALYGGDDGVLLRSSQADGAATLISFSPDSKLLMIGNNDTRARCVLGASDLRPIWTAPLLTYARSIAFDPRTGELVALFGDNTTRVIDTSAAAVRALPDTPDVYPCEFAFSGDGSILVATALFGAPRVMKYPSLTPVPLRSSTPNEFGRFSVAIGADGRTVFAGTRQHQAIAWDLATGREVRRFGSARDGCFYYHVVCSPDGSMLVTGDTDGLRLWDARSGAEIARLATWKEQIDCGYKIALSPNGKLIAGLNDQLALTVWDVATRRPLFAKKEYGSFGWVAFSPDSRYVACSHRALVGGERVTIVDASTGAAVRRLPCKFRGLPRLAYSPDGRLLAATDSVSACITLWDAASGQMLAAIQTILNDDDVLFATPDGRYSGTPAALALMSGALGRTIANEPEAVTKRVAAAGTLPPVAVAEAPEPARRAGSVTADPSAEGVVFRALNADRKARGLAALEPDAQVAAVARAHAEDMARNGYLEHINLEGESPFQRLTRAHIRYAAAAENIAVTGAASALEPCWMKSPGHRANILTPTYTHVGIGVAKNSKGRYYGVQVFITRP